MITGLSTRRSLYFFLLIGLAAAGIVLTRFDSLQSISHRNRGFLLLNRAQAAGDTTGHPDGVLAQRSIAYLEQAAERGADDTSARRALGHLYLMQGAEREALAAWKSVDSIGSELAMWGRRAERADDMAAAREWYLLATQLEPQNGDHWYRLAWASAQLSDADALDHYLRALVAPERSDFGRSNILTRLGELAKREARPDWATALARYEDAIGQDDFVGARDIVLARLGKAEALDQMGQFRAALDAYRWLADYRPGHYWANLHSGRLTWQVEKDAARAVGYLEKAISIDDQPKWGYLNLGLVYAQSGRPDQAIPLFRKVLALDPGDQSARNQLDKLSGDDEP
jgi:tetratricopeptide (TPR) repeat protein